MKQIELLTQVMSLIINSGVCPETKPAEWAKLIMWAHTRGFLYVTIEKDQVKTVACAYRIPYWHKNFTEEMPEKDYGSILYIAWCVSKSDSMLELLKMLRSYLSTNHITEIIYYKRNSSTDLKHWKLHKELVSV